MYSETDCEMAVQGHPNSEVVDFDTNRKRVWDFVLLINSNLDPISSRFRDIAGFLLKTEPYLYSTRILGVFPLD